MGEEKNRTLCKLVAKETDSGGYTTYVFEADNGEIVMCTRYPNWDHRSIQLGEKGYLEYAEFESGDTYRKEGEQRTYSYDGSRFIKFIKKETARKSPHKARMTKKVQDNE